MLVPAADILVLPHPAELLVRAEGCDIESSVLARRTINIGVVPRIVWYVSLRQVGSVPGYRSGRASINALRPSLVEG
jgi:hypothetical protein